MTLDGTCSYCTKPMRGRGWFCPYVDPITEQCDRRWCRFRTGHLFLRWPRWFHQWVKPVLYVRINFIFRWYDLWVGVYIDRENRRAYVFPLPMIGFMFKWEAWWGYWR